MISNHPGPWQQYQFRPDNKGLSVMEMKSKYLHEQYLFEAELFNLQQQHQHNLFMNGGVGGPTSTASTPAYATELQLSFNNTLADITNDFGFDSTNISEWNNRFINGGFEALTINNSDPLAPIITLKGNDTSVGIDADAFQAKTTLLSFIDLHDNCINEIGPNCFENNSVIQNVILNNVTTMGPAAFWNCTSLTDISFTSLTTLPNSLSAETGGVFGYCPLSSIDFLAHLPLLTNIGSFAFFNTSFRSLSLINDAITTVTIGTKAFADSGILDITMASVINFGDRAFAGNTALNLITLLRDNTYFDGNTFNLAEANGTIYCPGAEVTEPSIIYLISNLSWTRYPA